MKKVYNVLLIGLVILCLVGCGKKEDNEEKKPAFKQEFKLICERTNEDNGEATDMPSKSHETETTTFNKDGYVTLVNTKATVECLNDKMFEAGKDVVNQWKVENPTYITNVDEENKIITYEYENKYNPKKFDEDQKENGYITQFKKNKEEAGYTCTLNGITEADLEKVEKELKENQ